MKVIGEDGKRGYIVILDKEEIAKLAGFGSTYSTGFNPDAIKPGEVLELGSFYSDAYEALNNHKTAIDSAKKLQSAATRFLAFFKEDQKQ